MVDASDARERTVLQEERRHRDPRVLRRVRAGESDRAIARAMDIDRRTVRRYREWAAALSHCWSTGRSALASS